MMIMETCHMISKLLTPWTRKESTKKKLGVLGVNLTISFEVFRYHPLQIPVHMMMKIRVGLFEQTYIGYLLWSLLPTVFSTGASKSMGNDAFCVIGNVGGS